MIEMTRRHRIEVLVDAPLARKLAELAAEAGVTGYTLLRTVSGSGSGGDWSEDLVSGATSKMIFLAVANAERSDAFMEALVPLLDTHQLVVMRSEVEVVRPERF